MKKILFLVSFIIVLQLTCYDQFYQYATEEEIKKEMTYAFDSVIDLYFVSTIDNKYDFINSLDSHEAEYFFEYLRENYPKEYDEIPQ